MCPRAPGSCVSMQILMLKGQFCISNQLPGDTAGSPRRDRGLRSLRAGLSLETHTNEALLLPVTSAGCPLGGGAGQPRPRVLGPTLACLGTRHCGCLLAVSSGRQTWSRSSVPRPRALSLNFNVIDVELGTQVPCEMPNEFTVINGVPSAGRWPIRTATPDEVKRARDARRPRRGQGGASWPAPAPASLRPPTRRARN